MSPTTNDGIVVRIVKALIELWACFKFSITFWAAVVSNICVSMEPVSTWNSKLNFNYSPLFLSIMNETYPIPIWLLIAALEQNLKSLNSFFWNFRVVRWTEAKIVADILEFNFAHFKEFQHKQNRRKV